MGTEYFSDREMGARPRIEEHIELAAWGGIVSLINSRISDGSLGMGFPAECPDGFAVIGTDVRAFEKAMRAEIPDLTWPFDPDNLPGTHATLDSVEFIFRKIGKPRELYFHGFPGHKHLDHDRQQGQIEYVEDINRILARNGLAYELREDGQIIRLAAPILREFLNQCVLRTGDADLDMMLVASRTKFLDPNPAVRREALEKLWDAWERLKTILPGADKKARVKKLLDRSASEPTFREALENEAKALTEIGNSFQIRHSEMSQVPLADNTHVDYLFHRMFALIWLLLRKSGSA